MDAEQGTDNSSSSIGIFAYAPAALLLACIALSALAVFQYPLNHDVSWIISMTGQVRRGAQLYVDIIEVSPPLIVWLNMPISAAAELLQADPGDFFRASVLVLALGSVAFAVRILHGRLDRTTELSLLPALCYAAVAAAGYDFGQREHLALLLSLPYLAMAALRLGSERTSPSARLIPAAAGAVGFMIKPHFLLVPLLVELLILVKTRSRPDGSGYVIAGCTALYVAAVLVFAPEYVPQAQMLSQIYAVGFLGISPLAFVSQLNFITGITCVAFALMAKPGPVSKVLLAAALGFAGSALLQAKGWSYHWYPFAALGWPLAAVAATTVLALRGSASPRIVGLAVLALSAAALAMASVANKNPYTTQLAPVVSELGGGPTMIFSNTVRVSYPLLTFPGVSNASRLPVAANLSEAISSKHAGYETYLRDIVVADMVKNRPQLLIAEAHPFGMPPSFDFIEYLSRDPVFAREMAAFCLVGSVAAFRVYQRAPENKKTLPP